MKITKLLMASVLATGTFGSLALANEKSLSEQLKKEVKELREYYDKVRELEALTRGQAINELTKELKDELAAVKKLASEFEKKVEKPRLEAKSAKERFESFKSELFRLLYVTHNLDRKEVDEFLKSVTNYVEGKGDSDQLQKRVTFFLSKNILDNSQVVKMNELNSKISVLVETERAAYRELQAEKFGAVAAPIVAEYKKAFGSKKEEFELLSEVVKFHSAEGQKHREGHYSRQTVLTLLEKATKEAKPIDVIKSLMALRSNESVSEKLFDKVSRVSEVLVDELSKKAVLEKGISEKAAKLGIQNAVKSTGTEKPAAKVAGSKAAVKTSSSVELMTLLSLAVSAVVVRKKR